MFRRLLSGILLIAVSGLFGVAPAPSPTTAATEHDWSGTITVRINFGGASVHLEEQARPSRRGADFEGEWDMWSEGGDKVITLQVQEGVVIPTTTAEGSWFKVSRRTTASPECQQVLFSEDQVDVFTRTGQGDSHVDVIVEDDGRYSITYRGPEEVSWRAWSLLKSDHNCGDELAPPWEQYDEKPLQTWNNEWSGEIYDRGCNPNILKGSRQSKRQLRAGQNIPSSYLNEWIQAGHVDPNAVHADPRLTYWFDHSMALAAHGDYDLAPVADPDQFGGRPFIIVFLDISWELRRTGGDQRGLSQTDLSRCFTGIIKTERTRDDERRGRDGSVIYRDRESVVVDVRQGRATATIDMKETLLGTYASVIGTGGCCGCLHEDIQRSSLGTVNGDFEVKMERDGTYTVSLVTAPLTVTTRDVRSGCVGGEGGRNSTTEQRYIIRAVGRAESPEATSLSLRRTGADAFFNGRQPGSGESRTLCLSLTMLEYAVDSPPRTC